MLSVVKEVQAEICPVELKLDMGPAESMYQLFSKFKAMRSSVEIRNG